MTDISNGTATMRKIASRHWIFETEPHSSALLNLGYVRDDLRLKRLLKRAVTRDFAPQSLINAIKDEIRK